MKNRTDVLIFHTPICAEASQISSYRRAKFDILLAIPMLRFRMEITMEKYLNECAEVFLREQGRLFDEPVVENIEEAKEFLEDCFAQVFENIKEVRAYLDDEGMDVDGLTDEELAEELEVFALSNGRYMVVEA